MIDKWIKIIILMMIDAIAINCSYILSLAIRFEFDAANLQLDQYMSVYFDNFIQITIIKIAVFWIFDLYKSLWKYAGAIEMLKVAMASAFAAAAATSFFVITGDTLPRSIYILSFILDMFLIGGIRFSYRILRIILKSGMMSFVNKSLNLIRPDVAEKNSLKRILVVGAGDAAAIIIREILISDGLRKSVEVIVDDDPAKRGTMLLGIPVAGRTEDIPALVRKHRIEKIIIAIPSASRQDVQRIVRICQPAGCKLSILPGLSDLINEKVSVMKLRDVDILDLLGRETVDLDIHKISGYLEGKIVMVTGGGGSIGSELCRQIAKFNPKRLVALDIYENTVFALEHEMKQLYPELDFQTIIATVRNSGRLKDVFNQERPHVVFHAAAHKHVPLMERNPKEAVMNNILGTKNLVDISDEFNVERFVLISTDKAVNPTNVMGATKRAAEFIIQDKSNCAKYTTFSAVRFGNVLGSNGSVIPLFKKQIEQGGPITITHPEITRYFMTIPEAARLVIQAGAMASGGEIYILDMGSPIKIVDLAKNLIELSGLKPFVDIDIDFIGLRPGEKLYEELLLAEEGIENTTHKKIFIGRPMPMNANLERLLAPDGSGIDEINRALANMSDHEVKEWLARLVPSYTPYRESKPGYRDQAGGASK